MDQAAQGVADGGTETIARDGLRECRSLIYVAEFNHVEPEDFVDEIRARLRERATCLGFTQEEVEMEALVADEIVGEGLDVVLEFLCDEGESGLTVAQVRALVREKSIARLYRE